MAEGKGISVGVSLVITLAMVLVTGLSAYFTATYSMQNEMNLVKKDVENQALKITALEDEVKLYRELPAKIKEIQKTTDETNSIVNVIRDAMLVAGIIKPAGG